MEKVILLLCLAGLVFGAYIVDQPDAARGKDAKGATSVPNRNFGADIYQSIQYPTQSTYIQFDTINAIPASAIIDSAKLTYTKGLGASGSAVLYTAPILRVWGEGIHDNAPATTGECSYNHYAYPSTWTIAGCKGVGTDRTAALDSQATTSAPATLVIVITNTVQAIIDAGYNYGMTHWYVTSCYYYPYSSDYGTALKRPKLEVWYPDVPVLIAMKWRGYYDGENLRTWGIK